MADASRGQQPQRDELGAVAVPPLPGQAPAAQGTRRDYPGMILDSTQGLTQPLPQSAQSAPQMAQGQPAAPQAPMAQPEMQRQPQAQQTASTLLPKGDVSREQLLAAAAAARTPQEQADVMRRSGDVEVWGTTLGDLLTGSNQARAQFAQQLARTMPRALHPKTPEELAHINAQTDQSKAMADYYRTTKKDDLERDDKRADKLADSRVADALAKQGAATGRIEVQRTKARADSIVKAAKAQLDMDKLGEAKRQFDEKKKQGYFKHRAGVTVNVNAQGLQAAKALGDEADNVLRKHRDLKSQLLEKAAAIGIVDVASIPKPTLKAARLSEKDKMMMDDSVLKQMVDDDARAEREYDDRVAKALHAAESKAALQSAAEELAADEADPNSDVSQAKALRQEAIDRIRASAPPTAPAKPAPKGK
jgi:hypothetical protein